MFVTFLQQVQRNWFILFFICSEIPTPLKLDEYVAILQKSFDCNPIKKDKKQTTTRWKYYEERSLTTVKITEPTLKLQW